MFPFLRKYLAVLRIGLSSSMEYRANFLINTILFVVVSALIQMYLWFAVYHSTNRATVGGMSEQQMLLYIGCSVMCYSLTRGGRAERETAGTIRMGGLNNYLLKPISHGFYTYVSSISEHISSAVFVLVPSVLIITPLSLWYNVPISVTGLIAALPVLFLGMTMNFLMGLMISYLAFWLDEVWTFHAMKDISYALLSGMMVPLSVLPPHIKNISDSLPFQFLSYIPAGLISGNIPTSQLTVILFQSTVWLCLLLAATYGLWRLGLRRYGAFGG
ncbi:MAG: ABC-2 family transporter protein [Bacteriodetes bacterium]|nr:ABC-2 family transporter protein [Bacteroidota bacterium]